MKNAIKISFVGRPNVGKSTLMNSLLKEERVICDDIPGTTRDSVTIQWVYKGRKVTLVDTAGIPKKVKAQTRIQKYSLDHTMRAIKYSNVVICIIDAMNAFRTHDFDVA